MYDIAAYSSMIAFKGRTSAYARALEALVIPGAVVLDIGAGSGILSFLACRAGAAKVYAVESENIIQIAREAAADNGLSSRIELIQALSTEIELPEKVDGIVADIHGLLPLSATNVVAILDARDRFLKSGGWIIPAREILWGALAHCPAIHTTVVDTWDTAYQFDFSKGRLKAINNVYGARLRPGDLVVTPRRWAVLDYKTLDRLNVLGDISWVIERAATAHGICVWYDAEMVKGCSYTNSPAGREPYSYRHAFFPWPEAVDLMAGDHVNVGLRAHFVDVDYVWSWETRVTDDSGRVKARYRQSTFTGALVSHERLRRRAAGFVPEPNEDWHIDRRALELMGLGVSLGEVADALVADFGPRFKTWKAALARAADLSEKYSK